MPVALLVVRIDRWHRAHRQAKRYLDAAEPASHPHAARAWRVISEVMGTALAGSREPYRQILRFTVHPLTPARFDDFADVVNPNRRSTHCWCVVHRLGAKEIEECGGGSREQAMRALTRKRHKPGVIGYADGEPVGWVNIGPREEIPRLVGSKLITPVDDVPVWSIICIVVRAGHRKQGHTNRLIDGAVGYAASKGAPAVEAYPVDAGSGRIDLTMAFVGTRAMFDQVGFEVVGESKAMASGRPRLIMRKSLN